MKEYPQLGMVIVERQKDSAPMVVDYVDPWFVRGRSTVNHRMRKVSTDTVRARFEVASKPKGMKTIEWGEGSFPATADGPPEPRRAKDAA